MTRTILSFWDTWLLTFVLVVVVPVNGYVRFRRLSKDADRPFRKLTFYARVILFQWLLVGGLLVVATRHGLTLADLGQQMADVPRTISVTVALLATVGVVSIVVRRRLQKASPEAIQAGMGRMGKLAPAFGRELAAFVPVCVTAGICEELLYRGWLVRLLWVAIGSKWWAIAVGGVLFGIGHAYQGVKGAVRSGFVGAQLAALFVLTGSLLPGQVLHAAFDLLMGYAGALGKERMRAATTSAVPPRDSA